MPNSFTTGVEAPEAATARAPQVNGNHAAATTATTNGSGKQTLYPKSRVSLVDRYLDEPRKLRVAVIGGGLSGILGGILLPEKVPGIELVIYEKNAEFVSGRRTFRSRYPHSIQRSLTENLQRRLRVGPGWKMYIRVSVVTSHPTSISQPSPQRLTGVICSLQEPRSETIGRRLPRSTMCTNTQSSTTE